MSRSQVPIGYMVWHAVPVRYTSSYMMWYAVPARYTSNSSSRAHSTPAMSLCPQRKWLASFSADAPAETRIEEVVLNKSSFKQ